MKKIAQGTIAISCALAMGMGAFSLAGCSSQTDSSASDNAQATASASQESYTFTDDLGREVTVASHNRVVAGMGSFANIWELAGGTLVGASDDAFSDYGITSDAQKIGDFSSLNAESIIALNPDFVILTGSSSGRGGGVAQTELADTLTAANIPVAYFKVSTFDDYLRMLRTCCDITGNEQAFAENGQAPADKIEEIRAKAEGKQAGSAVVLTTYSGGTRVQSSSTQTGVMLSELGAENIADSSKGLLSDYSLEALIEANPTTIFLLPMGDTNEAAQQALEDQTTANPAWAQALETDAAVGQTVTVSMLYKGNGEGASLRVAQSGGIVTLSNVSDWTLAQKTFALEKWSVGTLQDRAIVAIQCFENMAVNQGLYIKAIKLELGEQQTLAHQNGDGAWVLNELPDYGGELLRCQRYYQVYTTAAARPAKALDCRPVMRTDPVQSTVSVGGATLYANSAEL